MNGLALKLDFEHKISQLGIFKNDQLFGNGLEITPNGTFGGQYKNSNKQGYGIFGKSKNQFFVGKFLLNQKVDFGIWHLDNGDKFEGNFDQNIFNGLGRYIHTKKSSSYIGEFLL